MKFYGIDAQGYIKIQQASGTSVPAFAPASDERRILYVDTGSEDHVYLGGDQANDWVRVVLDDGSSYTNLNAGLSSIYHPINGDVSVSMVASDYTGTTNHLRVMDEWVKISNGSPLTAGETAGIKVEMGSGLSDIDDAVIYFNYDDLEWYLDNTQDLPSIIATQDYVDATITGNLGGAYYTAAQTDTFFVAVASPAWSGLTTSSTTGRYYYTRDESYTGFVRVKYHGNGTLDGWSDWNTPPESGENPPVRLGASADTASSAWTIVQRDGSRNISVNIMNGTATSAYYADLAEKYTCDKVTPVGTVMEVSDGSDYEVVPCMFELSPSVIGVVSENPAHLMNSGIDGVPIALTGRVLVRVTGAINKGDFIVPAGDGMARKGEPSELSFKIGVSLDTDLQEDEKLIECVIK